jgi:hypothetical protein
MRNETESINTKMDHTRNRGLSTGSMVELKPKKGINKTVTQVRIKKSK